MDDYVSIGVYGQNTKDKNGMTLAHFAYLKQYKFKRGDHQLTITVKGKPKAIAIDPLGYLIDRNPNDNWKDLEN